MFIEKVSAQTIGTIGNVGVTDNINTIIATGVQLIIAVAGLLFFAMLILGGLKFISSGGDEKATASARQSLTNAFIGLIIVIASFLVAQLVFTLFKVPGVTVLTPP